MQTIYTNLHLQNSSDYRAIIEREARVNPERFTFYKFDESTRISPPFKFTKIHPGSSEFTFGLRVYAILRPAFRTVENRLGILSLVPKELPAPLTGNPVCPKGANLTLATILH